MTITAKEVKWIQLSLDVFNNKKIRAIEKMPEGDTLIVIWFKLLVLAGQINDGGCVYFTRDIPYTDQLLSVQFDRPIATIQLALCTFQKFGMINIVDDMILVSNWVRYQNEKWLEESRREKERERQKRWYDKQKLLSGQESDENLTLGNTLEKREDNVESLFLSLSSYSDNQSITEDKDKGCGGKEKKPKRERKAFVKPTVEEVSVYCKERNNDINPEAFYDHYESNGWVDKHGNPMHDWKATIRTWERWRKEHPQLGVPQRKDYAKSHYKPDGSYDYEAGQSKELESF